MLRSLIFLFLFSLLSATGAAAQAKKPPLTVLPKRFTLAAVKVTGSQLYSEGEVVAASGLKLNSQVTQEDLQSASNLLGTSGAFSNVTYRYTPDTANQVTAEFHVVDASNWLPVIFDNLVWFSREQLLTQLHSRLPLFKENLPQAGDLSEQARAVLEEMLVARGVQAKVATELRSDMGRPVDAVVFRAEGTKITIAGVAWKNVQKLDVSVLDPVVKPLIGNNYRQEYVRRYLSENVRPQYLVRGFLKARVADPQLEVASFGPAETRVVVNIPIEEGPSYKFKAVNWSGNKLLSAVELNKLVQLKPGDVANSVLLQQQVAQARKVYGKHGYLAARQRLQARLYEDETAEFEVEITEGDQYKMGNLEIRGVDPAGLQKLQAIWKLPQGAIYDDTYPDQFGINALRLFPNRGVTYSKQETINDQTKTVDLTIEFRAGG
jgi:outer membrane protein assembly factor BamA